MKVIVFHARICEEQAIMRAELEDDKGEVVYCTEAYRFHPIDGVLSIQKQLVNTLTKRAENATVLSHEDGAFFRTQYKSEVNVDYDLMADLLATEDGPIVPADVPEPFVARSTQQETWRHRPPML